MEAELYDLISIALSTDKSSILPLLNNTIFLPIDRIVWSVWDNVIGPELKFVWTTKKLNDENVSLQSDELKTLKNVEEYVAVSEEENKTIDAETESAVDKKFGLSENRYATVYSLSSEIFRSSLANATEFKLICVSERNTALMCYVYTATHQDHKSRHAISFILPEHWIDWFLGVKSCIDYFMEDLIVQIKISTSVESEEDLTSRITNHLTDLMITLQKLNSPETSLLKNPNIKISETLLSNADLSENNYIRKMISTHLQCQGNTVVIGSDRKLINKVIRTLALFESPENLTLCCYCDEETETVYYSPYLKLQGLMKKSLSTLTDRYLLSPWPVCFVDIDKKQVLHNLPFKNHQKRRRTFLEFTLKNIVMPNFSQFSSRSLNDDFIKESLVGDLLTQMDFLPYDDDIRKCFVNNFNNLLLNKAENLTSYVKSISGQKRKNNEQISLKSIWTALALEKEGDFNIVMAKADEQTPDLARYLFEKFV